MISKVKMILARRGFANRSIDEMCQDHFETAEELYPDASPAKLAEVVSTLWYLD